MASTYRMCELSFLLMTPLGFFVQNVWIHKIGSRCKGGQGRLRTQGELAGKRERDPRSGGGIAEVFQHRCIGIEGDCCCRHFGSTCMFESEVEPTRLMCRSAWCCHAPASMLYSHCCSLKRVAHYGSCSKGAE